MPSSGNRRISMMPSSALLILLAAVLVQGPPAPLPPAEFIVQLELASQTPLLGAAVSSSPQQLARRLEAICGLALGRALGQHLFGTAAAGGRIGTDQAGSAAMAAADGAELAAGGNGTQQPLLPAFRVRVLGLLDTPATSSARRWPRLRFTASLQGRMVPAQNLVHDLSLLSLAELSAMLQLPVLRVDALAQSELSEQAQWWVVAFILAGGLLLIGCGWALLFCWLNLCLVRRPAAAEEEELPAAKVEAAAEEQRWPRNSSGVQQAEENSSSRAEEEEANGEGGSSRPRVQPAIRGQQQQRKKNTVVVANTADGQQGSRRGRGRRANSNRMAATTTTVGRRAAEAGKPAAVAKGEEEQQQQQATEMEEEGRRLPPLAEYFSAQRRKGKPLDDEQQQQPNGNGGTAVDGKRRKKEMEKAADEYDEAEDDAIGEEEEAWPREQKLALEEPNSRFSPYWAGDQLARLFRLHALPAGHPRPAPPTEAGELRIG